MSVLFSQPSLIATNNVPERISQLKITLAGLAYECSHSKRVYHCPFLEIEHMTFKEKLVWIDQLPEVKKQQIMNFHYACSYNRDSKCI